MEKSGKFENLSGEWTGIYDYPDNVGGFPLNQPPVPFNAVIVDKDGALTGEIIEEDTFTGHAGTRQLYAFIDGVRTGQDVEFTKSYNQGKDADHSIDYRGTANEDFTVIEGTWTAYTPPGDIENYGAPPTFSGPFIMNRGGRSDKAVKSMEAKEELLEVIGQYRTEKD